MSRSSTGSRNYGPNFNGPSAAVLQKVLDGGVKGLPAVFKGIQFVAHLAWLRVAIADAPTVGLNSPNVGLTGVNALVSATGELWWYHPTFHCSFLCFNWSETWSWDKLASVTVRNVQIAADAHVALSTKQALVVAQGVFDKLRLNYPILDQIPLEGVANNLLGPKLVAVYDAGKYVAAVPILGSKFAVNAVEIPPAKGSLIIDIQIKQV